MPPLGLASPFSTVRHAGTPRLPHWIRRIFSTREARAARFNDLLSGILFTRKSQFVDKISALADLVDELGSGLESASEELCERQSLHPERDWELLDSVHYDLNTCLRETMVLFKSFLHALPKAQVRDFEAVLRAQSCLSAVSSTARARHLAHRRMAFLKGQ